MNRCLQHDVRVDIEIDDLGNVDAGLDVRQRLAGLRRECADRDVVTRQLPRPRAVQHGHDEIGR